MTERLPDPVDHGSPEATTARPKHALRIQIDDFPQLALLAWNRADRTLSGEDALALYEREWAWVDQQALQPAEWDLIHKLAQVYGRGVLHV